MWNLTYSITEHWSDKSLMWREMMINLTSDDESHYPRFRMARSWMSKCHIWSEMECREHKIWSLYWNKLSKFKESSWGSQESPHYRVKCSEMWNTKNVTAWEWLQSAVNPEQVFCSLIWSKWIQDRSTCDNLNWSIGSEWVPSHINATIMALCHE